MVVSIWVTLAIMQIFYCIGVLESSSTSYIYFERKRLCTIYSNIEVILKNYHTSYCEMLLPIYISKCFFRDIIITFLQAKYINAFILNTKSISINFKLSIYLKAFELFKQQAH